MLADEWEGLYINGKLFVEGMQLGPNDILAALGIRAHKMTCKQDWFEEQGRSLPVALADVKF